MSSNSLRHSIVVALVLCGVSGCRQSQYYRDQGAMLGAMTGALTGAAIGDKNGEALAGAAVGTMAGALVGSAIGDGIDQDVAQAQAVAEQRLGRKLSGAVSLEDVVSMTHANLSDDVIITQIRANGVARRPQVDELITLRGQGVSDDVIKALQGAQLAIASPAPPLPAGPPVIVEQHHYIAPPRPYRWYRYPHRHPRHHHAHSGVHWGFSFGN